MLACHAESCGFKSRLSRKNGPFRLEVRTTPFHGGNAGSIPARDIMKHFNYFLNNSNLFKYYVKELKLKTLYSLLTILITIISCYVHINQLIYIFTSYLLNNMNSHRFIFTGLTEVFFTYIKFAFIIGLFFSIPFILLNF